MSLTLILFEVAPFIIHPNRWSVCISHGLNVAQLTASSEITQRNLAHIIFAWMSSRLPAALPQENYTCTIISDPWSLVFFQVLNHLTMQCLFCNRWLLGTSNAPFWRILLTLKAHHGSCWKLCIWQLVSCRRYTKIWGTIIIYEGVQLGKMTIDVFSSCVTPGICKLCNYIAQLGQVERRPRWW